jgi:hypothetical protein
MTKRQELPTQDQLQVEEAVGQAAEDEVLPARKGGMVFLILVAMTAFLLVDLLILGYWFYWSSSGEQPSPLPSQVLPVESHVDPAAASSAQAE